MKLSFTDKTMKSVSKERDNLAGFSLLTLADAGVPRLLSAVKFASVSAIVSLSDSSNNKSIWLSETLIIRSKSGGRMSKRKEREFTPSILPEQSVTPETWIV